MQGSQKSKRVSWASDGNLCQVRLFLTEDTPSQVGLGTQDHLQAKTALSGFSVNGLVADDNLPPGFEGFNPASQSKTRLAQITVVKWRSPPKFILDDGWQVVSGAESKEVEIQNQRELRVLEAYYPRQSAIPPNPAIAPVMDGAVQDDRAIPLVPITPIEEDDLAGDPSSNSVGSINASSNASSLGAQGTFSSSPGFSSNNSSGTSAVGVASGVQEDALKAALTAVAKTNEQIDHDLLVKILTNPAMLEHLVRHQGPGPVSPAVQSKPMEGPQIIPKPLPLSSGAPVYKLDASPAPFSNVDLGASSSAMLSNSLLYPYPNGTMPMTYQQSVSPLLGVAPQVTPVQSGSTSHQVKDLNYFKNLVQQHGEERQAEPQLPFLTHHTHHPGIIDQDVDNSKSREVKPKIMKPCLYFNTSKGCRNGANCIYQHDMSSQQRISSIPEMQSAKRLKMDREIRGSQSYS